MKEVNKIALMVLILPETCSAVTIKYSCVDWSYVVLEIKIY